MNKCCEKAIKDNLTHCPICGQAIIPFQPQQMVIPFNDRLHQMIVSIKNKVK